MEARRDSLTLTNIDVTVPRQRVRAFWSAWAPIFLPCACLVLLPVGRMVEIPVLLMAVGGLFLALRHGGNWLRTAHMRTFLLVFAAYWMPILLSWPDAVNRGTTAVIVINSFRFLLSGLFIVHCMNQPRHLPGLHRVLAWILLFWTVDAVIQSVFGTDLFGYRIEGGRLNAVFGGGASKFSIVLAALAPLLWEYARRYWPVPVRWLVVAATTYVILAGGTRSGWIMLLVACGGYLLWLWHARRQFPLRALLIGLIAFSGLSWFTYATSPTMATRVHAVVTMLTTDMGPLGDVIGHRLWIWRGAANMIAANPVNGVGARGFRDAYQAYASLDDPYLALDEPIVPTHSHQLLLEVSAETGLIGLAGLVLMWVFLGRAYQRAPPSARLAALPFGLCLLVLYFPSNTHLAAYSAFFSQLAWWLIALYCAALNTPAPVTSQR